jgi:DNA-binding transcriptional MocR family regulator
MKTINQLAEDLQFSRYKVIQAVNELGIESEIQMRKSIRVQVFSDEQAQSIANHLNNKEVPKTSTKPAEIESSAPSLLEELATAKAQVDLLRDERDYLRKALTESQEATKTMAEQLFTADQRVATVIAAMSKPKELTEKKPQKISFWHRLFN